MSAAVLPMPLPAQPTTDPQLRVLGPDLSRRLCAINAARAALSAAGYVVVRQDVRPRESEPPLLTLERGDAQLLARCTLMRALAPRDMRARFGAVDVTWPGALS